MYINNVFYLTCFSIGTTKGKNKLWVLKINSQKAEESSLPAVRFVAGLNGYEPIATELLIQLAVQLVTLYEKDTTITNVSPTLSLINLHWFHKK